MRTRTIRSLAPLCLLALSACAGPTLRTLNVQDYVQQSLASEEEEGTLAVRPQPGAVEVLIERQPLVYRNGNDIEGDLTWTHVVPPSDIEMDPWLESLRERYGTTDVIVVADYSESLAAALDHHLREHFTAPSVRIVDPNSTNARPDQHMIVATHIQIRDNGIKRVDLAIRDAEGTVVTAQGERRTRRNLSWVIPLNVLTGVVGWIVSSRIMPHIHRADFLGAFGEAIDELARSYAERLASSCRSGAAQCSASAEVPANRAAF